MSRILYALMCFLVIFTVNSCKNDGSSTEVKKIVVDTDKGMEVTVLHAAGDLWNQDAMCLALPFNVGQINDKKILILSDRLDKGKSIKVMPLGAIRVSFLDSMETYVLALPTNINKRSFNPKNFDEFSTVFSDSKWMLEQFILNCQSTVKQRKVSWENEKFATHYLEQ